MFCEAARMSVSRKPVRTRTGKPLIHIGATTMIWMNISGLCGFCNYVNLAFLVQLVDTLFSSYIVCHSGQLIVSPWAGPCVMMVISLSQFVRLAQFPRYIVHNWEGYVTRWFYISSLWKSSFLNIKLMHRQENCPTLNLQRAQENHTLWRQGHSGTSSGVLIDCGLSIYWPCRYDSGILLNDLKAVLHVHISVIVHVILLEGG